MPRRPASIPALDALQRLREGNARFTSTGPDADVIVRRHDAIAMTREPFAIVLG